MDKPRTFVHQSIYEVSLEAVMKLADKDYALPEDLVQGEDKTVLYFGSEMPGFVEILSYSRGRL